MFDPGRDQLGHLETLIDPVSQLFVELRIAALRKTLHLRTRLCDKGNQLRLHLCRNRLLDGFDERSRRRHRRPHRRFTPRMCRLRQGFPQCLGLLLETRDGLGIVPIGLHQLCV